MRRFVPEQSPRPPTNQTSFVRCSSFGHAARSRRNNGDVNGHVNGLNPSCTLTNTARGREGTERSRDDGMQTYFWHVVSITSGSFASRSGSTFDWFLEALRADIVVATVTTSVPSAPGRTQVALRRGSWRGPQLVVLWAARSRWSLRGTLSIVHDLPETLTRILQELAHGTHSPRHRPLHINIIRVFPPPVERSQHTRNKTDCGPGCECAGLSRLSSPVASDVILLTSLSSLSPLSPLSIPPLVVNRTLAGEEKQPAVVTQPINCSQKNLSSVFVARTSCDCSLRCCSGFEEWCRNHRGSRFVSAMRHSESIRSKRLIPTRSHVRFH